MAAQTEKKLGDDADEEAAPSPVAPDTLKLQATLIDYLDANDVGSAFEALVAPDALIRSLLDPAQAATGRDKVVTKLREIAGKLKGRLGSREAKKISHDTTRCLCAAKVLGTTVRVGFEFRFSGNVAIEVGLAKNPDLAGFFDAREEPSAEEEAPTTTCLVPRPVAFPPRTVDVQLRGLQEALSSPYLAPRLINPYVKVSCGAAVARTKVVVNSKTPDFGNTVLRLVAVDSDRLDVVLLDYNVARRNQWLAKGSLDLATLPLCEPQTLALSLDVRKSVTNQSLKPDTHQALRCTVTHFDLDRWWHLEERAKQAEAQDARLLTQEQEQAAAQEEQPPQVRAPWWRVWA